VHDINVDGESPLVKTGGVGGLRPGGKVRAARYWLKEALK
jgi:hypothetical protein